MGGWWVVSRSGLAIAVLGSAIACGDDGGNGPGPSGSKPDELPTFTSIALYASGSPFNQRIPANPGVDPNSDVLVGSLLNSGDFLLQVRQFSTPVFFADENTPRHDVTLTCGSVWGLGVGTMRSVPIPTWAEPADDVDGADNPPVGCGEDSDQDNNMIILDLARRCELDFWQARTSGGAWVASWGNRIEMGSSGVYTRGLSTRGSGFAFLGGVIWPDELRTGQINHALVFSYPFTKSGGPVAPATDSDGEVDQADAIPEGARLQLNPALDLNALSLTPYERTIARAMQEYGMILTDNGTTGIGLYAIDPRSTATNPYQGVLPDVDYVPLAGIPLDQFRVLTLPAQNADWRANLGVSASDCAVID